MQSALFELDDLGILRSTKIPPRLSWMTLEQIDILLAVLFCGEGGMTRRRAKKFDAESIRLLELRDYLQWERDRFGRLAFLCLTWKGDEAAQVLRKIAQHDNQATRPATPD
jgi:hypothetical protein